MIYIDNVTTTQYIAIPFPVSVEASGVCVLTLTDEASGEEVVLSATGTPDGDYIVAELTLTEQLRKGEYRYLLQMQGSDYDTRGVAVVGDYGSPYVIDGTEGINIIQYER